MVLEIGWLFYIPLSCRPSRGSVPWKDLHRDGAELGLEDHRQQQDDGEFDKCNHDMMFFD